MLIVEINAYSYGSTGNIMMQIAEQARKKGHKVITYSTIIFSGRNPAQKNEIPDHRYFSSYFENFLHYSFAQLTDGNGFFSILATFRLIHQLKKLNPDVVHLHNLHQFCINIPLLARYINKNKIKTVWTFHDCWAFTGHCMHFEHSGCNGWKTGCGNCPQRYYNPRSRVDWSKKIWKKKYRLFSMLDTLAIVTPSEWLARLVRQSFFCSCPVTVINNGINTNVFMPHGYGFKETNGFEGKYIVLGVSSDWGYSKGLDVFVRLAQELGTDYKVVLVGLNEHIAKSLPECIFAVGRTSNKEELAKIYSAADVFVNPTREDTFPTVNMEALACGTPVVTFDTGGSPEILDSTCGVVVEKDDFDSLKRETIRICQERPFTIEDCVKRAGCFQEDKMFSSYLSLYESMINGVTE